MPSVQQQQSPQQAPTVAPQTAPAEHGEEQSNSRDAEGIGRSDGWTYEDLKTQLEDDPGGQTADQYAAICARIARHSQGDLATLRGDNATMTRLFSRLSGDNATLALQYLGVPLREAVRWHNVAGGMAIQQWSRLVSGRSAAECLAVIQDNLTYITLRNMGGATATEMFPPLLLDPVAFQAAMSTRGDFMPWIIETDGVARLLEIASRIAEYEADKLMREGMIASGMYTFYRAIMQSPTTDDRDARMLYNWLLVTSDVAEAMDLFRIRFGVDLANQEEVVADPTTGTEAQAAASWDHTSILRTWQVCGRLPLDHVRTATRMLREGESGDASGWANGRGEIGMEWGTDQLGNNEVGAYTDDYDTMRGLNIFDATLRHEIGHTVGFDGGFDSPGGFVFTQFDWQQHADFEALVTLFHRSHRLPSTIPSERRARILGAFKDVSVFNKAGLDERLQAWADHHGDPDIVTDGQASDLYEYLRSRMVGGPWNEMSDVDGRSYHVDYAPNGDWVSCPVDLYGKKVSRYAMRSPAEWFAEAYATFYADADTPNTEVGSLLRSRDRALYTKMRDEVHESSIWNMFNVTGQDLGQDTMGV